MNKLLTGVAAAAILVSASAFATDNKSTAGGATNSGPGVQGPADTRTGPATKAPGDASGSGSSGTSSGTAPTPPTPGRAQARLRARTRAVSPVPRATRVAPQQKSRLTPTLPSKTARLK
jgi:hypothetical protein